MHTIRVMTPPLDRVDHLPDGSAGLCFLLFGEGRGALVVLGPRTRAEYTRPLPFVLAIHVSFPTGGAYPYFGVPLETLADRVVPARELWGDLADRLLDELLACGVAVDPATVQARTDAIERALVARRHAARRYEPAAAALARAAAGRLASAAAPIPDLAADLNISERSLRRAFSAVIGVPPKVYARIARFRRVAQRVVGAHGHWAELAIAGGYADQAHLAREFVALAGVPPSAFSRPAAADHLRTVCPSVGS